MSKRKTVCFTGMEAAELDRLTAMFAEANRRLGNAWSLAPENDAEMLVIDVDSLYGHMSWLKVHNSGRTVVALSSSPQADADHVLSRPVTLEALTALLQEHGDGLEPVAAPVPPQRGESAVESARRRVSAEQPAVPVAAARKSPPPRRVSAEQIAVPDTPPPAAVAPEPPRAAVPAPPAPVPAAQPPAPVPAAPPAASAPGAAPPAPAAPAAPAPPAAPAAEPRLIDYLQPGGLPGAVKLQRGNAPMLVLDPTARVYFGGSGLKEFLPYANESIAPGAWTVVPASELAKLRQELGGPQPFARLQWLAALMGGGGALAPGLDPNGRFRLTKWPQIEREFAKHFRIATTMMKGFLTVAEIAQQSGATAEDVADFVNASLVSGAAETDAVPDGGDAAAVVRGGLFGRLRGR